MLKCQWYEVDTVRHLLQTQIFLFVKKLTYPGLGALIIGGNKGVTNAVTREAQVKMRKRLKF